MSPVNVLVIFYSHSGATEKLALAAAVGAVQARANIRLRRLPDSSGAEEDSENSDALARMRREYVPPTSADVTWADAVIIGLNGKLCGAPVNATGATTYGRKIASDTRALKSA